MDKREDFFANKATRTFELPPEGVSLPATLIEVENLGLVSVTFEGKTKEVPMVRFKWQTDATDSDGAPFQIWERLTNSLHPKSKLVPRLGDLLGYRPGRDATVSFRALEGIRANLIVKHNTTKTYANLAVVIRTPTPKEKERQRHDTSFPPPNEDDGMPNEEIPFQ
jgi:hypothetical protein